MSNKTFIEKLDKYREDVLRLLLRLTKCPEVAKDIFQDACIKALLKVRKNQYAENGHFREWLYRIAYNIFIDGKRKDKQHKTYLEELKRTQERHDENGYWKENVEQELESLLEKVEESLWQDKKARTIFSLHLKDGLTFRNIQEQTGVNHNTVKTHYYRKARQLQQQHAQNN